MTDAAMVVYKKTRSYRDLVGILVAHAAPKPLRGLIIETSKGFLTATFMPVMELMKGLEPLAEDNTPAQATPHGVPAAPVDILQPVAPR